MAHILHFIIKKGTIKMIRRFIMVKLVYFLWITSSSAQFFEDGYAIKDVKNGINWLRCTVGQTWNYDTEKCDGEIVKLNHMEIEQAQSQASEQLGGSWRLPTLEELESLVCKVVQNRKSTKNIFQAFHLRPIGQKHPIFLTQKCIGQ